MQHTGTARDIAPNDTASDDDNRDIDRWMDDGANPHLSYHQQSFSDPQLKGTRRNHESQ